MPGKRLVCLATRGSEPEMVELDRILVVDDNEASRGSLARLFLRNGCAVTTAADGEQALALARHSPFDLVVLDVWMPKADGWTVLRALRESYPATALPVIMATADSQSEAIVRALEAGANDYVTKPYDFPVLLARVRTQLALKRA